MAGAMATAGLSYGAGKAWDAMFGDVDDLAGATDNLAHSEKLSDDNHINQRLGAKPGKAIGPDADRLGEIHQTARNLSRDAEGNLRTVENFGDLKEAGQQIRQIRRAAYSLPDSKLSLAIRKDIAVAAKNLNNAYNFYPTTSSLYSDAIQRVINRMDRIAIRTQDYAPIIRFSF